LGGDMSLVDFMQRVAVDRARSHNRYERRQPDAILDRLPMPARLLTVVQPVLRAIRIRRRSASRHSSARLAARCERID
jgi:hypothetical protein